MCSFMCYTSPFKFSWYSWYIYSSFYYHHQIGNVPIVVIVFRGCVSGVVVPSYHVGLTNIPGKLSSVSFILCSLMCANNGIHYFPPPPYSPWHMFPDFISPGTLVSSSEVSKDLYFPGPFSHIYALPPHPVPVITIISLILTSLGPVFPCIYLP